MDGDHAAPDAHARHRTFEGGAVQLAQARVATEHHVRRPRHEHEPPGRCPRDGCAEAPGARGVPGLPHLDGLPAGDVDACFEEVGDGAELLLRKAGDHLPLGAFDRVMQGAEARHSLGDGLDEDASAVGRVGDASDVPGLLQAVDHPSRGPRGEARPRREVPHGHGTFVVESLETLHVDGREPDPVGHRLAEQSGLAAHLAGRPQHRLLSVSRPPHRLTPNVSPGYCLRCAEIS